MLMSINLLRHIFAAQGWLVSKRAGKMYFAGVALGASPQTPEVFLTRRMKGLGPLIQSYRCWDGGW